VDSDASQPLGVLMAMVGVVLLIACTNIAMLLIARNTAREREFSLRMALGAGRSRIFRQLLTESVLLVGGGAALGWIFAAWGGTVLARGSGLDVSVAPDSTVLFFALAPALLAGLAFGLAPLPNAVRVPPGLALKGVDLDRVQRPAEAPCRPGRGGAGSDELGFGGKGGNPSFTRPPIGE